MKKSNIKDKTIKSNNQDTLIRKLRINFIVVMMLIVLLFLAVILIAMFISGKRDMRSESFKALRMSVDRNMNSDFSMHEPLQDDKFENSEASNIPSDLPKSTTPTLSVLVKTDGNIELIRNNIFFIEDDSVEALANLAMENNSEDGTIEKYNLRFLKRQTPEGTMLAFVDTSSEEALLKAQILRSIWISLAVLTIMFLISLFLSKWIIKPVENAWESQKQFVADASHELKTPLTVILSNTDMLIKAGIVTDTKNAQRLDNVKAESTRMKALIENLMTIAKGDSNKGTALSNSADMSFVDMSFVVTSSLLTWEPTVYDNNKKLSYTVNDNLGVYGDSDKLRRLTDILIDNAVKYSLPKSTITVTLSQEKMQKKKSVLLSVASHGEPLNKEQTEKIFERFYRADKSRGNTPGYGLGLSIATTIVNEHNAKIWAESDGVDLNTFYVNLPLCTTKE